jgi:hypothetical protein
MKQKITTWLVAIGLALGCIATTAVGASAATPNSGLGYTQYWVYRDYCPAGQVWINRAWYIRTDYNAWYETLYGLRDYDRYDHTDYHVAKYVWPC